MNWLERICTRYLNPCLPVLVGIFGALLTYDYSRNPANLPMWLNNSLKDYSIWIFGGLSFILFLSSVFVAWITPLRQQLEEEVNLLRDANGKIGDNAILCLEQFIWGEAKKIGFEAEGKSRISIYLHDEAKSRFFCIIRKSYNMEFQKKGRSFFPDSSGCIALAWRHDWHFDADFPENEVEAANYHKTKYSIKKSVFSGLTMKPLLLAAKKIIDNHDRPLGLIVIESCSREAFAEEMLRTRMTEAAQSCAVFIRQFENYLPSPTIAEEAEL